MGGYGSGQYYRWDKKTVVEDCLCLDIGAMIQSGAIRERVHISGQWVWRYKESGKRFGDAGYETNTIDKDRSFVRLHYKSTNSDTSHDYKISLIRTKPNYGGERLWFSCPITGDMVAKLYLHPSGGYFASRKAHGLSYNSQRICPINRAINKKWGIISKAGGEHYPVRPKGMHHKTFEKILMAHDYQESLCDMLICKRFAPRL